MSSGKSTVVKILCIVEYKKLEESAYHIQVLEFVEKVKQSVVIRDSQICGTGEQKDHAEELPSESENVVDGIDCVDYCPDDCHGE